MRVHLQSMKRTTRSMAPRQRDRRRLWVFALALLGCAVSSPAQSPQAEGFQGAAWASTSAQVRDAVNPRQWSSQGKDNGFPAELNVTVYTAAVEIAGYPANVKYFFYNDSFFQATASFQFPKLVNYDFNYNVYRSVDEFYHAVRDQSLTFVFDVFRLLETKYGRREPVFDKLDPRKVFQNTDAYINRETWNLRYHPYEYYRHIIASAYARWDFPKTRVTFSVNISASDKRFDYLLSATSLDLQARINAKKDEVRSKGL